MLVLSHKGKYFMQSITTGYSMWRVLVSANGYSWVIHVLLNFQDTFTQLAHGTN